MPFCFKCGTKLFDNAKFCQKCGTPVAAPPPGGGAQNSKIELSLYEGSEKTFGFTGALLTVPSGMDVFNHYRLEFRKLARLQTNKLQEEYTRTITDLDAFLTRFPILYAKHRQPLMDAAMDLFAQAGIYDLSPQQFEEQHSKDFCLCGEDVNIMIDSFNKTIQANQDRKAQGYNLLPGMVFSGLGGFVKALALNVAVTAIAEADIKNANVTPKQRQELFRRINPANLMERAFLDYWRIFLSMTWWMNQRGLAVWYPNVQDNQRATGLYQNLSAGRIPQEKVPEIVVTMLSLNPYVDDYLKYVHQRFGKTEETSAIFSYFGFEGK